jgi:hypothetical protein
MNESLRGCAPTSQAAEASRPQHDHANVSTPDPELRASLEVRETRPRSGRRKEPVRLIQSMCARLPVGMSSSFVSRGRSGRSDRLRDVSSVVDPMFSRSGRWSRTSPAQALRCASSCDRTRVLTAANCGEMRPAETRVYAHLYAHRSPKEATDSFSGVDDEDTARRHGDELTYSASSGLGLIWARSDGSDRSSR